MKTKAWRCPGCQANNRPYASECEQCGHQREQKTVLPDSLQCAWRTSSGARCLMPGTIGPSDKPGYCGWHHDCLRSGGTIDAESWPAYEYWWLAWYGPKVRVPYCVVETHYPASYSFQAICGRAKPDIAPSACRVGNCRFREFPAATREDAMTAIRRLLTRMRMPLALPEHVKDPVEPAAEPVSPGD